MEHCKGQAVLFRNKELFKCLELSYYLLEHSTLDMSKVYLVRSVPSKENKVMC